MASQGGIVAQLIVGAKAEPYLSDVLESIAGVCDHAVVNDNSGLAQSANAEIIGASRLARESKLTLLRTSFVDFASARNACLDATGPEFAGAWGLFVDADEVHGEELAEMAQLLPSLPPSVDAVDGYSRHMVGSFSWWMAVQRRLCFFRILPARRWQGAIHERLAPSARSIVLPSVWFHYGHVVTPRAEAEKSKLYAALDGSGRTPSDEQIESATAATVWPGLLRRARRFRGTHPAAVAATIATLSLERAALFAEVDALVARQSALDRLRNAAREANFGRLLAWRKIEARLRYGYRATGADGAT